MTGKRSHRRAVALIPALVCLALVTMLGASLMKLGGMHRRVVQADEIRVQAEWLAQSGLARGAAKTRADPSYAGETWVLPGASLNSQGEGLVHITVENPKDSPLRHLKVEAEYPRGSDHRTRRTLTRTITIGPAKPGESS